MRILEEFGCEKSINTLFGLVVFSFLTIIRGETPERQTQRNTAIDEPVFGFGSSPMGLNAFNLLSIETHIIPPLSTQVCLSRSSPIVSYTSIDGPWTGGTDGNA